MCCLPTDYDVRLIWIDERFRFRQHLFGCRQNDFVRFFVTDFQHDFTEIVKTVGYTVPRIESSILVDSWIDRVKERKKLKKTHSKASFKLFSIV